MLNYMLNIATNEDSFIEQLSPNSPQFNCNGKMTQVLSNKKYKINITGNLEEILFAKILINENEITAEYDNGNFDISRGMIFQDIFGYAVISVAITFKDSSTITLYSNYLKVLIDKTELTSVKLMLKYIYENSGTLLFSDEIAFDSLDITKRNIFSVEEQIELLKKIIGEYKKNFPYLKNNKYSKLQNIAKHNSTYHSNIINNKVLIDASRHPYYLKEIDNVSTIQFEDKYFTPNIINSLKKEKFYNVYENITIVSFIYTIFIESQKLLKELKKSATTPHYNIKDKEYFEHDDVVESFMADYLIKYLAEINAVSIEARDLFVLYRNEFSCEYGLLHKCPRITPIFAGISQYNSFFKLMYYWFNFNNYDFDKENFLLSFTKNNKIYEYFILFKLINYFKSLDFLLITSNKFIYDKTIKSADFSNTFVFKKGESTITLYFQPTIFGSIGHKNNGVDMIRNNIILTKDFYKDFNSNNYYLEPDFIIKLEKDEEKRYLIIDTKFSRQKTVKEYYLTELIFKYIFSVMPHNNSKLQGLCVINGKKDDSDRSEVYSVYTTSVPENYIPSVNICTISPTNINFEIADFEKIKLAIIPLFL